MNTAIKVREVVLRRAEWERNAAGQVLPVPETWDRAPTAPEILALVTCPACKKPNALVGHKHSVDRDGKVSPRFSCAHCAWEGVLLLDRFHKKPLWAIAVERTTPRGEIVPEIVHVSADDEAGARRQYMGGRLTAWGTRIVGVARAIGYHAGDEHGETLIA